MTLASHLFRKSLSAQCYLFCLSGSSNSNGFELELSFSQHQVVLAFATGQIALSGWRGTHAL